MEGRNYDRQHFSRGLYRLAHGRCRRGDRFAARAIGGDPASPRKRDKLGHRRSRVARDDGRKQWLRAGTGRFCSMHLAGFG